MYSVIKSTSDSLPSFSVPSGIFLTESLTAHGNIGLNKWKTISGEI